MKRQLRNRIKALFLLIVFSMNTIAGFACSAGLDMGYNKHHHEKGGAGGHHHSGHKHSHKYGHAHGSRTHGADHMSTAKPLADKDCCSNDVASFTLLDKALAHVNYQLNPPISSLDFTVPYYIQLERPVSLEVNSRFQFVRRSCTISGADVRVAIQSFQI